MGHGHRSGRAYSTDPGRRTAGAGHRLACARAGCPPESLACVQAHGTGTAANDLVETRAIRRFLGDRAAQVPIVSMKGAIGHLMGSAGAVETALAVLACRDRRCPGTATLLDADPELGRLALPRSSFSLNTGAVLKTSLGFAAISRPSLSRRHRNARHHASGVETPASRPVGQYGRCDVVQSA